MADIFMRFPYGRTKGLTLSYDDGVIQDKRLIEIMNKYGLKGTFNINSGLYAKEGTVYPEEQIFRKMTKNEAFETYKNSGQEVAVHTLTHPFLKQLPEDRVTYEIIKDRENLETQFDTIVKGMAYPYGEYDDKVIQSVKCCGIAYARTVISTYDFRLPDDWFRLTTTCHHKSPELKNLGKKFIEDKVKRSPYLFYLWGHSYEFDTDNNWYVIEDFAKYIGGHDDIFYATNIEIYDYIQAYKRLVFSIDQRFVFNPSARKVWFEINNKVLSIDAGAKMEINSL